MNVSQESMGSGDRAGRLVLTAAMAYQSVRGGNKICQRETDFVVERVQADSSTEKVTR